MTSHYGSSPLGIKHLLMLVKLKLRGRKKKKSDLNIGNISFYNFNFVLCNTLY